MSSPVVSGIYYSKMPGRPFMWAFIDSKRSPVPAHFGNSLAGPYQMMKRISDGIKYNNVASEKAYLIVPKGMLVW